MLCVQPALSDDSVGLLVGISPRFKANRTRTVRILLCFGLLNPRTSRYQCPGAIFPICDWSPSVQSSTHLRGSVCASEEETAQTPSDGFHELARCQPRYLRRHLRTTRIGYFPLITVLLAKSKGCRLVVLFIKQWWGYLTVQKSIRRLNDRFARLKRRCRHDSGLEAWKTATIFSMNCWASFKFEVSSSVPVNPPCGKINTLKPVPAFAPRSESIPHLPLVRPLAHSGDIPLSSVENMPGRCSDSSPMPSSSFKATAIAKSLMAGSSPLFQFLLVKQSE